MEIIFLALLILTPILGVLIPSALFVWPALRSEKWNVLIITFITASILYLVLAPFYPHAGKWGWLMSWQGSLSDMFKNHSYFLWFYFSITLQLILVYRYLDEKGLLIKPSAEKRKAMLAGCGVMLLLVIGFEHFICQKQQNGTPYIKQSEIYVD